MNDHLQPTKSMNDPLFASKEELKEQTKMAEAIAKNARRWSYFSIIIAALAVICPEADKLIHPDKKSAYVAQPIPKDTSWVLLLNTESGKSWFAAPESNVILWKPYRDLPSTNILYSGTPPPVLPTIK